MRHTLAAALVLVAASGCTVEETDPQPSTNGNNVGKFPEGTGQQVMPGANALYPSDANWGVAVNDIVPNWSFVGLADSYNSPASAKGYQLVSLADFYNPSGYDYEACVKGGATDCAQKFPSAVFPEGSPWAGKAKPRALSLGVSAGWCGPCNAEAKSVLPGEFDKYKVKGGHFMVALVDGWQPGIASTLADINKWTKMYKVEYSLVTDPNDQLMKLFTGSLPSNAIVRTSDMKILYAAAAAPTPTYWAKFEAALASPN
jgi:hypothetical protein